MIEKLIIKIIALINLLDKVINHKRQVLVNRSVHWQGSNKQLKYLEQISLLENLSLNLHQSLEKLEQHDL